MHLKVLGAIRSHKVSLVGIATSKAAWTICTTTFIANQLQSPFFYFKVEYSYSGTVRLAVIT